jgi:DNA-binding transcriptional MocR family regulator
VSTHTLHEDNRSPVWSPKLPPVSVPARGARGGARPRPLYLRIVDALAADVAAGRVQPSARLPTQRELAERLGTTIATITRAYTEARRRGLVSATVGRGTFVQHTRHATPASGIADLTINQLLATPFGGELAAAASTIDADLLASLLEYQPHPGHLRHRRIGAGWVAMRGLEATPDEIVVTAGAQHALLVALATLTRPGDTILVEALTYTGLISVANHLHLQVVPVAMDAGGLDVDAFARAAKRTGARVAYLMPSLQNPTGVTLSPARRKALLQAAAKHDVTILEDDEYGAFSNAVPLAVEAPDRCIYFTGVSKSVAPGVRVGFLRAPASLVPRLGAAVFASTVMASPFGVEIVGRWLADGLAERVIEWKREEFTARATVARQVLGLKDLAPACPHVWLPTERHTAMELVEQARLRGVLVSPGQSFAIGRGPAPQAVRLCLGPPATREALMQALAVVSEVRSRPAMPHAATV